jgi:hypothetical protein
MTAAKALKAHKGICTDKDIFLVPEAAVEGLRSKSAWQGETRDKLNIHVNTGDSKS